MSWVGDREDESVKNEYKNFTITIKCYVKWSDSRVVNNNMRMIHHNREYSSSQVTGQKNVDFYLIVLDSTRYNLLFIAFIILECWFNIIIICRAVKEKEIEREKGRCPSCRILVLFIPIRALKFVKCVLF